MEGDPAHHADQHRRSAALLWITQGDRQSKTECCPCILAAQEWGVCAERGSRPKAASLFGHQMNAIILIVMPEWCRTPALQGRKIRRMGPRYRVSGAPWNSVLRDIWCLKRCCRVIVIQRVGVLFNLYRTVLRYPEVTPPEPKRSEHWSSADPLISSSHTNMRRFSVAGCSLTIEQGRTLQSDVCRSLGTRRSDHQDAQQPCRGRWGALRGRT